MDVAGDEVKTTAMIVSAPIYDPQNTKTHA